jgi:bifunctional DNA-binding transcriptional regulator/antitoxin component of YhaV-PrlF toxin-antitoxin module
MSSTPVSTPYTFQTNSFHANANHIHTKQSISINQIQIEDLLTKISNMESRLSHLENKLSSPSSSQILDEEAIKEIIKGKMTNDIKHELCKDHVLQTVHDACFKNPLELTDYEMKSIKKFETAWNEKGKRFSKHESCSDEYKEKNLLKRKFFDIVRMCWYKYNIFSNDNPANDLTTTGIYTSKRFEEIVDMISVQLVSVMFNSKQIVNQVQLPPYTRKNYNINIQILLLFFLDISIIIQEQMKNKVKRAKLKQKRSNLNDSNSKDISKNDLNFNDEDSSSSDEESTDAQLVTITYICLLFNYIK